MLVPIITWQKLNMKCDTVTTDNRSGETLQVFFLGKIDFRAVHPRENPRMIEVQDSKTKHLLYFQNFEPKAPM